MMSPARISRGEARIRRAAWIGMALVPVLATGAYGLHIRRKLACSPEAPKLTLSKVGWRFARPSPGLISDQPREWTAWTLILHVIPPNPEREESQEITFDCFDLSFDLVWDPLRDEWIHCEYMQL